MSTTNGTVHIGANRGYIQSTRFKKKNMSTLQAACRGLMDGAEQNDGLQQ